MVGIGVVIEEYEQGIKVLQVIPDGPAEQAGVSLGDVITEVDGNSLKGESIQTVTIYLKGEADTAVTITFIQDASRKSVQKILMRKAISLLVVETDMLSGQIGNIRLNSFSLDAGKKVTDAIQSLPGVNGYILDLRDNVGGYVTAAQDDYSNQEKHTFCLYIRNGKATTAQL